MYVVTHWHPCFEASPIYVTPLTATLTAQFHTLLTWCDLV